ncbi:hypothetical protein GUJ93_ZPchr0009g1191 [Zizania palustris]|uniref:Uncharacterized protein n=1 Tax=Zizania palustris TaxID=103762 RepID=A0A8J5R354_ZIZPA|nr:hypothetical protein GUJ93_ZPchr0009g1191 [Zizania palustris]
MNAIIGALSAPGESGITGGLVVRLLITGLEHLSSHKSYECQLFRKPDIGKLLSYEPRNDHKDITNKIEKNMDVLYSAKLSRNEQLISRSSGTPA